MTFGVLALHDSEAYALERGAANGRPNVLLLVLDDVGYNDLGINGNTGVTTPNIDRFAHQGVRFTRHYASDSTCAPTRAALLTGQYPARLGFTPDGRGLSPQIATLPRALDTLGYTSHHVGKWHIGHTTRGAWPDAVGFDSWFGFLNQWLMGKPYHIPIEDADYSNSTYFDPWLSNNGDLPQQHPGHLTEILTRHTVELIGELKEQNNPWFINHWFYAPHTPLEPTQQYLNRYGDNPQGHYLAMLHMLDNAVGRILEALKRSDQYENTLVLIVSDNGGTNAQLPNNFPYHGNKVELLEGGLRTPLLVRWPARYASGNIASTVSTMDLFPTILVAVGGQVPSAVDGISLHASLLDPRETIPPRPLFWSRGDGFSVLSSDGYWRLVRQKALPIVGRLEPISVLNNLGEDPTGKTNVLELHPNQAQRLERQYRNWFRDIHRIPVAFKGDRDIGHGILLGDDFQRTPGFRGYTFAMALIPGADKTSPPRHIAEQPGVWGIRYHGETEEVAVRFGNEEMRAALPTTETCHSLVISANFRRRITNWPSNESRYEIRLFVDGQPEAELSGDGVPTMDDVLGEPIHLGNRDQNMTTHRTWLGIPEIYNVSIQTELLPAEWLHQRLCATKHSKNAKSHSYRRDVRVNR